MNPGDIDRPLCDYGHPITGTYSTIRVPLQDEDGFPVVDLQTGEVMYQTFKLPNHHWRVPVSEEDPLGVRVSKLEPKGQLA